MLIEALIREGGQWGLDEVTELGALSGSAEAQRWGELADRNIPVLHTHDRYGHRVDEIEFHPAYHELMAWRSATACTPPRGPTTAPARMWCGPPSCRLDPEPGHVCPISMTYAVVPALRHNAELAEVYEPLLTNREYDPELKLPTTKAGITAGMSMTEKQGGSDVRAGTTPGHSQRRRRLHAHRPQVVLLGADVRRLPGARPGARRPHLLPAAARAARRQPQPNVHPAPEEQARQSRQRLQRGRVRRRDGWLVGEEGRGVPTIIEMVNLTRLDCTLGSATHAHRA